MGGAEGYLVLDNPLRITMPKVAFKAKLRRWGNTFGLTVSPKEVARLNAREGTEIFVEASTEGRRPDFSRVAVFRDPDPLLSEKHDDYLADYTLERKRSRKR